MPRPVPGASVSARPSTGITDPIPTGRTALSGIACRVSRSQPSWPCRKASASPSRARSGIDSVTFPSSRDTRSENRRARADRFRCTSTGGEPGRTGMEIPLKAGATIAISAGRQKPLTLASGLWQAATFALPTTLEGMTMPKAEWGTKRICPTTGKRFYDLNKTPIVSPYTGEVVDIESVRRKMAASVISRAVPEKDDDVLVEDIEADDDLLPAGAAEDTELDDDLLEDDADDNVSARRSGRRGRRRGRGLI